MKTELENLEKLYQIDIANYIINYDTLVKRREELRTKETNDICKLINISENIARFSARIDQLRECYLNIHNILYLESIKK